MFYLWASILLFTSVASHDIPSFVHLCNRNDPELSKCVVNTINELRPYLKKGIPEMNLPPIEPFNTGTIRFTDNRGNTAIDLEITDGLLSHFSEYEVKEFSMDLSKGYYSGLVYFKKLQLRANYKFKGKLLVFTLNGEGDLFFDVDGFSTRAEWFAETYTKDGKEWSNFVRADTKTTVENVTLHFNDLFKNNPALTESFNGVINQNQDIFLQEFLPLLDQTFNKMSIEFYNDVFKLFPLDDLYPK